MCESITNAEILLSMLFIVTAIVTCSALMRLTKMESDFSRMAKSNRFLRDQINRDRALLDAVKQFHEE